jgi:hypothetical protein
MIQNPKYLLTDQFCGVGTTIVVYFLILRMDSSILEASCYGFSKSVLALFEKEWLEDSRPYKAVFCRTSAPAAEARGSDASRLNRVGKSNRTGPPAQKGPRENGRFQSFTIIDRKAGFSQSTDLFLFSDR